MWNKNVETSSAELHEIQHMNRTDMNRQTDRDELDMIPENDCRHKDTYMNEEMPNWFHITFLKLPL